VASGRCSAGGCTPVLAHVGGVFAIVCAVFLLVMTAVFWWGARNRSRRRHSSYEFDEKGRAHRVPADEDPDA
jgi:hypothetical protein